MGGGWKENVFHVIHIGAHGVGWNQEQSHYTTEVLPTMRTQPRDTLSKFITHHDNDVVSTTPRARLVIFGREVDASEGNVNGALMSWQADGDARTRAHGYSIPATFGDLWARAAEGTYMPAQTIEATPAHTMWVCTDCMLADVNHDFTGVTPERAAELWSTPGTTGVYVGDESTDLEFGTMPCDTCGTHLAGARFLYEYDI